MSLDTTARDIAADAIGDLAVKVALHTGDPGAGAANELSGGGYARQTAAWDAASGGVAALSGQLTFSVPAVDVAWASVWNDAGTVRYGKYQLTDPASFPVAGIFYINAADIDLS